MTPPSAPDPASGIRLRLRRMAGGALLCALLACGCGGGGVNAHFGKSEDKGPPPPAYLEENEAPTESQDRAVTAYGRLFRFYSSHVDSLLEGIQRNNVVAMREWFDRMMGCVAGMRRYLTAEKAEELDGHAARYEKLRSQIHKGQANAGVVLELKKISSQMRKAFHPTTVTIIAPPEPPPPADPTTPATSITQQTPAPPPPAVADPVAYSAAFEAVRKWQRLFIRGVAVKDPTVASSYQHLRDSLAALKAQLNNADDKTLLDIYSGEYEKALATVSAAEGKIPPSEAEALAGRLELTGREIERRYVPPGSVPGGGATPLPPSGSSPAGSASPAPPPSETSHR